MVTRASKRNSILLIAAVYVIAFVVVYCIFPLLSFSGTMINVFIADAIATAVIFIFSLIFSNSSVYDPYWSVVPPVIAIYLMIIFPGGCQARKILLDRKSVV
jgi:hypothetical protein